MLSGLAATGKVSRPVLREPKPSVRIDAAIISWVWGNPSCVRFPPECFEDSLGVLNRIRAWANNPSGTSLDEGLSLEDFLRSVPVHEAPKGRDVIWPSVLIIQVVGMLPDVQPDDGSADVFRHSFHKRGILIGSGSDGQVSIASLDQPSPT